MNESGNPSDFSDLLQKAYPGSISIICIRYQSNISHMRLFLMQFLQNIFTILIFPIQCIRRSTQHCFIEKQFDGTPGMRESHNSDLRVCFCTKRVRIYL